MTGVENTKIAIKLIVQISIDIAETIKAKKKVGWFKLVTQLVGKAFPISELIAKRSELLAEIKDISEAEKLEISNWVEVNCDLPNTKSGQIVERAIILLFAVVDFGFEIAEILKD